MCKSTIWALALHIYKYVTVQPTPFAFHCFAVPFAHKMAELLQIIKKHLHK